MGAGDRKAARNLRAAAQDRFIDRRRGEYLSVEHHRKALADILRRHAREGRRSARIEAAGADRPIALRINALLRVDQLLAIDNHLAPQKLAGRRRGKKGSSQWITR